MKEECFQIAGKPHLRACGEFWNLRGQHNWQKKKKEKKKPAEYMPNYNCQQRSGPEACVHHQRGEAGQEDEG